MPPSSEAPRDLADRVIRQALQHPANLRAFLHQAVPALAGGFDCERGRLLEREFPLDDWRRREADLPFEVPYPLGDDELWALVYVRSFCLWCFLARQPGDARRRGCLDQPE